MPKVKKKPSGELRKNAGISLHPKLIELLEKYRGRKSRSLYTEEILSAYFTKKSESLNLSEKAFLKGDSL